jgi:ABC-type transporter Mla subunit MlaD
MSDVTGTLASNDQALASLITHLGNVMGDFDATLAGNEANFHTTIVTLDPLLSQLNGTLTLVYADSKVMIGQINTNNRVLQPELISATSQTDGNGNILRQFFVLYPACDQPGNGQCQTGTGAAPAALPALPSLPSLPKLPLPTCLPTPSVPKLTTPTISPCPSLLSPSAAPSVPCMPATPKPPKLPTPTPSLSLCPSLPGLPLPVGAIPDWLSLLLSGAAQ